jgi:uncharacterized phiE125 gp8 family phage protein
MSGIEQTTPTREPLFVDDVRNYLRLDDDVEETLIVSLIVAARNWAENYTGRAFITRTVSQYLDGFIEVDNRLWEGWRTGPNTVNYQNFIELAAAPVISVTHVKYFTDDNTENTWAASNYHIDTIRTPSRIALRDGGSFPSDLRSVNGLKIVFEAGYGASPVNVPDAIKMAMMQYCTFMYEHRGDFERFPPPQPPKLLTQLLQPYQIMRFSSTPYSNILRTGIG